MKLSRLVNLLGNHLNIRKTDLNVMKIPGNDRQACLGVVPAKYAPCRDTACRVRAQRPIFKWPLILFVLLYSLTLVSAQTDTPTGVTSVTVTRIATGLLNPRGVVVMPGGSLLVAEVGTGEMEEAADGPLAGKTGRLSLFHDFNRDGDFDDASERVPVLDSLPAYNILYQFNPGRDEVVGIGDLVRLADGRVFFTQDDNFETLAVVELDSGLQRVGLLTQGSGSMNSLVYDENRQRLYIAESTLNSISSVTLDGDYEQVVIFDNLANGQQAVPSGLALDPLTGDLLVTLFSGQLWDYYGEILSFMPGHAKVVRLNPETGEIRDEITGLTTAVDLAVGIDGTLYVVEMTTTWPTPTLSYQFDLLDPDAPPDPGGYARYTGRVTLYPPDRRDPVVLTDKLDAPTNITLHETDTASMLYVSTGQGTPGRTVWGPDGLMQITGELIQITLPHPTS